MNALRCLVIACALAASWGLFSAPALACKCMVQSVDQAKTQADAIFEGRVTRIEDAPSPRDASLIEKRVTFAVVRVWKELENAETVSITTSASTASCGYPFEQGQSYLVYAGRGDAGFQVSTCSRTRPMSDAGEDLAGLGGGVTPVTVKAAEPKVPQEPQMRPKSGGCASTATSTGAAQTSATLWWLGAPGMGLLVRRRRKS